MKAEHSFFEQRIIEAVKRLLDVRVNEIFSKWEFFIPIIEFGKIDSLFSVSPTLLLSECEQTEKERIIQQNVFSLSISFSLQEHEDGELFCYAYSTAFNKALNEDVTLDGIVDRAVITGKKYTPPKKPNCGEGWGLVLSIRITVEGMSYDR